MLNDCLDCLLLGYLIGIFVLIGYYYFKAKKEEEQQLIDDDDD